MGTAARDGTADLFRHGSTTGLMRFETAKSEARPNRGREISSPLPTEARDDCLARLVARMPQAVICMMSAAWLNRLVDEPPEQVWVALPAALHGPRSEDLPYRLMRWSRAGAFDIGILEATIGTARIRHTGPARTVVDLIRYARHARGEGAGINAAKRWVARGGRVLDILDIAQRLRLSAEAMHTTEVLVRALEKKDENFR